ncbi:MAG: methylmalonyl-CoA mutase family protein, partial [Candidatus Jordarchaeales archaeon]
REISSKAYSFQKAVERGEAIIVGINMFREEDKVRVPVHRVDPTVEEKAVKNLEKLRRERDNEKVKDALEELRVKAEEGRENLMPVIIKAVKAYATIGELCGVLREVYGEYAHRTEF